jgi:hypothetical protein
MDNTAADSPEDEEEAWGKTLGAKAETAAAMN